MSYQIVDEQDYPRITPAVQWLIAINVAIYFLQITLVSPHDVQGALGFEMGDQQRTPWTALTYMFVHGDFWHLLFNMYMLWVFGPRVEHAWRATSRTPAAGTQTFTFFYIWCGLGGWIAHLFLIRNGLLLGASGAIYGVMLAYAIRWPHDEIYFFGVIPMKVRTMVAILFVLDLFRGLASMDAGGGGTAYLAHIGGFVFALAWIRWPSSDRLDRIRERIAPAPDTPDETPRAVPRSMPRPPRERGSEIEEIIARSKAAVAKREPAPRPPLALSAANKKEALNLVLDKISEKGLASLTTDERRLLEEMSRKLKSEQGETR